LGAIASLVFSVVSVNLLAGYIADHEHTLRGVSPLFVGLVTAVVFVVLTTSIIIGSVASAFRHGNQVELLVTVLVSYLSLIVVFASIYYQEAFFGDYQDAVFKFHYYREEARTGQSGPALLDRRAFYGIENRFWSGVDWPVTDGHFPDGLPAGSYAIDRAQMRVAAGTLPIAEAVRFLPEARLAILGDCLHLSVITMTTVGYGDITPRSLPSRVAADVEALCYTLLLIFGLGIVFGNIKPQQDR
jgi:hypothetical protein